MGQFRITITASGGHGCQRELGDGSTVLGCNAPTCPDCMARDFVGQLKAKGNTVTAATLEHWPGEPRTVVDDLLTGVRSGDF